MQMLYTVIPNLTFGLKIHITISPTSILMLMVLLGVLHVQILGGATVRLFI